MSIFGSLERTDTSVVGPVSGQLCNIMVVTDYPPTGQAYMASLLTSNNKLVMAQNYWLSLTSTEKGIKPLYVRAFYKSQSTSDVIATVSCYASPNVSSFLGNLNDNGELVQDITATMTLNPRTPSSYQYPTLLSSVPYRTKGSFQFQQCGQEVINTINQYCYYSSTTQSVTRSNPYFSFTPVVPYTIDSCNPNSYDASLVQNFSVNEQSGYFQIPSQAFAFACRTVTGEPTNDFDISYPHSTCSNMRSSQFYTSQEGCLSYKRAGIYGYSNNECNNSVNFIGFDGTNQLLYSSLGTCDNGDCVLRDGSFQCSTNNNGGNGGGEGSNRNTLVIIIVIAIILIVIFGGVGIYLIAK